MSDDNHIVIHTGQVEESVDLILSQGHIPFLLGDPGTGKTALYHDYGEKKNLVILDRRVAQMENWDFLGLLTPNQERTKANYLPLASFPLEGDSVPEGKDGWLLILDEITLATAPIQRALYRFLEQRELGDIPLHEKVHIVAAGNRLHNQALVQKMSTALRRRMVHLFITVNTEHWLKIAAEKGFHPLVRWFIKFRDSSHQPALSVPAPDQVEGNYPNPSSWEKVSDLLWGMENRDNTPLQSFSYPRLAAVAGCIGTPMAREFNAWIDVFPQLTPAEDILADPENIPLPEEASHQIATLMSLERVINKDTIGAALKYSKRLGIDFQIVLLSGLNKNGKFKGQVMTWPAVKEWLNVNTQQLIARKRNT